jgi:hypothetical protein
MQQRQLRLGDTLDDYCPRERRLTNHVIVAMIGDEVKQTRCTTCDADHEYKHAKVPRQRKKSDTPAALYAQVAAGAPKRVVHDNGDHGNHDAPAAEAAEHPAADEPIAETPVPIQTVAAAPEDDRAANDDEARDDENRVEEEGPAHRRLIRASLPRPEGQQPPARPIPEFTIRQPGNRPNRFRPRHQRGGQMFHGNNNRSNGSFGGPMRGNMRPQGMPRMAKRHGGGGRKRSK